MFAKTAIVRLNVNGTMDNSFDGDGIIKAFSFGAFDISALHSVAIQNDGKILVSGSKNNNIAIARLNSDGSIDNSYATNGIYSGNDMATNSRLVIQNDGKLLVTYSHATQTQVMILRINQNGTNDAGFGTNGKVSTSISGTSYAYSKGITIQPDGKILVAGSAFVSSYTSDFLIVKYNSDGTIDNTFGSSSNGIVMTSVATTDEDRGEAIALQSNGKIVVAGSKCTGSCYYVLLRYNNTITSVIDKDYSYGTNFNIYPNPNNGTFIIQSEKGRVFELSDITGRVINTYTSQNTSIQVNEHLPAGMYFIREKESGVTQKIVIE